MAITVVGSLDSATGTALTSLTLTAAASVGDLRVLISKLTSSTISISSISGGNCGTAWTRVAGPTNDTNGTVGRHEMWIGTVANGNSSGHEAITVTWSSSTAGLSTDLDCRSFTNSNTSTTWARDGTQSGFNNNAASTTITYPSLTASGTGRLYVGHARAPSGGSYGTPSGSGFTWATNTDANGNPVIYSLATGSGTVAPTQSTTSSATYAIGVLLIASTTTTWALAADGLASSSGGASFTLSEPLAADGKAASSGSAAFNVLWTLAADGKASSSGSAFWTNVLAADGKASSSGTAALTIAKTLAADGKAASSGSALLTTGKAQDPFAVVAFKPKPALLGCGVWRVFVATRGGGTLLAELDFSTLTLTRKLSDTSDCSLVVSNDQAGICAPVLAQLEPFQHEIVAYRNYAPGDSPAWAGPVTVPEWGPVDLTMAGKDLFSWMDRRKLPFDRDFLATDLGSIFGVYLSDGFIGDMSPNPTLAFRGEIGTVGARSVTAASATLAGDALRELARSGVDFTVAGRQIIYGGMPIDISTATLYEPAVVYDPGGSSPKLTKQGLNMATRVTVNGATVNFGVQVQSTVGFPDARHGLVDQVVSEPLIMDALSATEAGAGRLAFLNPAPQYLTLALTPQAPMRFEDLIPGIRLDTAFGLGTIDVLGPYRLSQVQAQVDDKGSETITLTLVPLVT